MGIASLILGITSMILGFFPLINIVALIFGICGTTLAVIELKKIKTRIAIGGLVTSIIGIIISLIIILLMFGTFAGYFINKHFQEEAYKKAVKIESSEAPKPLKTFSIDVNPVVKKEKIEFNKVLLAFSDDNLDIELKEKKEIIQNAIFEIFENTNADDFNHVKSMIDLSEKIKEEVNDNLSSGKISEVYFKH